MTQSLNVLLSKEPTVTQSITQKSSDALTTISTATGLPKLKILSYIIFYLTSEEPNKVEEMLLLGKRMNNLAQLGVNWVYPLSENQKINNPDVILDAISKVFTKDSRWEKIANDEKTKTTADNT